MINNENKQNINKGSSASINNNFPEIFDSNKIQTASEYMQSMNPKPDGSLFYHRLEKLLIAFCRPMQIPSDVMSLIDKLGHLYVPVQQLFVIEHACIRDFGVYLNEFVARDIGHHHVRNYQVKAIKINDEKVAVDIDKYTNENLDTIITTPKAARSP